MDGKNCCNCGAPLDPSKEKCEYCGTPYYDLSALCLSINRPVTLKIMIDFNGKPVTVTGLAMLKDASLEMRSDNIEVKGGMSSNPMLIYPYRNLNFKLDFDFVEQNGRLATIKQIS